MTRNYILGSPACLSSYDQESRITTLYASTLVRGSAGHVSCFLTRPVLAAAPGNGSPSGCDHAGLPRCVSTMPWTMASPRTAPPSGSWPRRMCRASRRRGGGAAHQGPGGGDEVAHRVDVAHAAQPAGHGAGSTKMLLMNVT